MSINNSTIEQEQEVEALYPEVQDRIEVFCYLQQTDDAEAKQRLGQAVEALVAATYTDLIPLSCRVNRIREMLDTPFATIF